MNDRLTMNVPGKPEYVGTVRIAAAHVASRAGFDIEAIEDIKVAISEACTNIVCHSHKSLDFTYDVELELDSAKLSITVKDEGVGFGVDDYVEPVPGEERESGLGIFIIRALMDEVDICSEIGVGTKIQMAKHLGSTPV
ncbi:MAG: ATP-binding protein [Clostridiales bacterium]|nr:ATP-binding protein [Clostridiales bacterium]